MMDEIKMEVLRAKFEEWAKDASPQYYLQWNLTDSCAQRYSNDRAQHTFEGFCAAMLLKQTEGEDTVERAARAMALHVGWTQWDTATDFTHTQSGNDPADERDYFRGLALVAIQAHGSDAA